MKQYYVYIATNKSNKVLYTGMSNELSRRMFEHASKISNGFTARYNVHKLVFYDIFPTAIEAIEAEKRIKGWTRVKKINLIESSNPEWRDLLDRPDSSAEPQNDKGNSPE